MSLAARCPACGTVFRVVQDQLRVSEGWVRCGRCAEVFNAIENLVDVDAAPTAARSAERDRARDAAASVLSMPDSGVPTSTFDEPRHDADGDRPTATPPPTSTRNDGAADATPASVSGLRAEPPPFVRRAERAARWQRPGVRAGLAATTAVAAALLGGQAVVEYRDTVAARWPSARDPLEAVCRLAGCRIAAPRAIEALTVESSGLVRIDGSSMYRLNVVLRNRSALALASPAIDLTLTDSQGAVIARRTLALDDLGLRTDTLAALNEFPLQATLNTQGRNVSGYTIEVFYP